VGIRDHQLDAGEPAALELAQELDPEGLGLRRTHRHAEHLAAAVGVDRDGDGHSDRDDPAGLAHLQVGRVNPEIGPITFEGTLEEGQDPLVDLSAQAADLALGDAGHAERLDQLIDAAGRDAVHVGLLDHRREGLLSHPARLQEAWEVAALPELGDAQLDRPGARLPNAIAVAVALRQPLRRALAIAGAGQALYLEFHQAFGGEADHLAQEIGVGALLQQLAKGDAVVGHRRGLRSAVAGRNPTLPEIPRWPPAVDSWPAYARCVAVAAAGHLPTAPTPPTGTSPVSQPLTATRARKYFM
jgi:hypothetical protein